jgi:hypothetical protein
MESVYTDYFQKSKVFLYPLLEMRKGIIQVPIQTYVEWEGVYTIVDCKFMCEYTTKMTPKFNKFSISFLEKHPLYEEHVQLAEDKYLYVFNFIRFKSDFKRFVDGEYSLFSLDNKIKILDFFSSQVKISKYVSGFLTPDSVHEDYALYLGVSVEAVQNTNEVCSPPDLEKETLVNNNTIYQLLKASSISLEK